MTQSSAIQESSPNKTCATLATPAGRGAVATVVVAGANALAWADQLLRPAGGRRLSERAPRTPVFGRWPLASGACEEVVACRTTETRVEVHCHGGPVAAAAIIATFVERGAEVVSWEDLADSAPNDARLGDESFGGESCGETARRESLVAIARRALADCRTPRAALVLLDQLSGAWTRECAELARLAADQRWESLAARCDALLTLAPLGARLARPWRVALAGRPNAGKSSLANTLAGYERAIVSPAPGTTRDTLSVDLAIDGWPVELVDTAGVRTVAEPIEAEGVRRASAAHATADLVLVVADVSAPWTDFEQRWLDEGPRALVVHAKCDLAPTVPSDRPAGCAASVVSRQGLDELLQAIALRFVPQAPAPGEAVPLLERQCALVRELRAACDSADAARVEELLAQLPR